MRTFERLQCLFGVILLRITNTLVFYQQLWQWKVKMGFPDFVKASLEFFSRIPLVSPTTPPGQGLPRCTGNQHQPWCLHQPDVLQSRAPPGSVHQQDLLSCRTHVTPQFVAEFPALTHIPFQPNLNKTEKCQTTPCSYSAERRVSQHEVWEELYLQ